MLPSVVLFLSACTQSEPGGECGRFVNSSCAEPMVCIDPGPAPGTTGGGEKICVKPCEKCGGLQLPGTTGLLGTLCCPTGLACVEVDKVSQRRFGGAKVQSAGGYCVPERPWNTPSSRAR
jgi:hypothetical protein